MRIVKVADGYALYSENGNAATCAKCPVRDRYGMCRVRAEHVAAARPCCNYGHRKINSANTIRNRRKTISPARTSAKNLP